MRTIKKKLVVLRKKYVQSLMIWHHNEAHDNVDSKDSLTDSDDGVQTKPEFDLGDVRRLMNRDMSDEEAM